MLVAMATFVSFSSFAAIGESTGNLVGSLSNMGEGEYSVNATDPSTGRSRNASVSADGSFRFSQLPLGQYDVTVTQDGKVVARDTFTVSLNSTSAVRFDLSQSTVEEIIVTATRVTGDVYSTDSGLVLSKSDIDLMPVAANVTGISLLAPGVVLGDARFGLAGGPGLASFGGSSVAENSCYINGLEVTNTRQGLGCGEIPWEFYDEFQVKTGGYSAQYGRTTGGVLNAVSKSGSNEWEFGVGAAFEPGSLYEEGQVSRGGGGLGNNTGGAGTGRIFRDSRQDENSLFEYWVTASGPIIEDKLFIYAIVNPRDQQQDFSSQTSTQAYTRDNEFREIERSGSDNVFWGTKIDWDVTDYQRLSFFAYSNRNDGIDVHFPKDSITDVISDTPNQTIIRKRGGEAQSISYQGTFFDDFTVSAMWGTIETEYTSDPDDTVTCPSVTDNRSPAPANPITGCGPGGQFGTNTDENTQVRLDLEWNIGDHLVRTGLDQQDRESTNLSIPIGGHRWTYQTLLPNASIQGNAGPIYTNNTGAPIDFTFDRIFSNEEGGGKFSSELTAYYIEDEWQFNDSLVFYIGARKDQLTNSGATGVVFADFDQEWAPRLGLSWDPTGNGQNKVYSTWGRYYLPIANNTNFRVAAGINDTTVYYNYTGVDSATGSPTGTAPISGDLTGSTVVNSVAQAPTQDQFQAAEADPFYKDEFILGYERLLGDEYSAELRFVYRDTGATLDDYCGFFANPGYCTLVNPGFGGSWSEFEGGPLTFYSAETIGLPKGRNEYTSLQVQVNRASEDLNYSFIYAWGRSVGNFEGAVKSDIVQADAGITQDFDFPALMDGADGYLPNDRRHVFKFFGSYRFAENWTAGWNASLASGRPLSVYGSGYPDQGANVFGSYGDTYYLFTNTCNTPGGVAACPDDAAQEDKIYRFTGRGNNGRTPWLTSLDASLTYAFQTGNIDWSTSLQVFNLLDIQEVTHINEHAEARRSEGNPNEFFGAAYGWQQPRHVRLSLQARF
jgi:hypothetical protein